MNFNSRWVLLTFFPENDRESIDAIANGRVLKSRDLVPIVSLDGSAVFLQASRQEQISCF